MKGIVFDLDDTLYNEKDFVYGGFQEVALYLSHKYVLDSTVLYQQMIDILYKQGRGKVFDIICEQYAFKEDISALVELYRRARPKLHLYEDAETFLRSNLGKYKLGLITDGLYYVQWNKIKLLGIEKYFDEMIVTDDYGKEFWKPSKAPYIEMSQRLELLFNEMVYIGDNPNKDFYAAKQLGILTIRIIREQGDFINIFLNEDYEADFIVRNLYEVEKFLK
ncbi:MAG: putative hydrolase of the superfamily [Clostridiales bacterium]|nr:putative hydrolase of the superfamily [Clostridiales bacterium]